MPSRLLNPSLLSPLRSASLVILALSTVQSATVVWDGGGSDNSWNTADNWNSAVPASTSPYDDVQFKGSTQVNVDIDSDVTVRSLLFYAEAAAFTLDGSGGITVVGTGTSADGGNDLRNESSSTQTITNDLNFGSSSIGIRAVNGNLVFDGNLDMSGISNIRFLANNNRNITLNGVLSGNVSSLIAFNSGGSFDINNYNTYNGTTSIWTATVRVSVDSLIGQNGAFGSGSQDVRMGTTYNGGALTGRLLTSAPVTIGRNIELASVLESRINDLHQYTIGGDSTGISSYTGTIFTSNGSGAKNASKLTLTAAAGGRVNIANIVRHTSSVGTNDDVVKIGNGIIAITGANNNWQGYTLVQTGTLLINGTVLNSPSGKNTQVSANATLGGIGILNRDVTLAASAILSPGDIDGVSGSLGGKLTIGGALTLDSASILNFDLGSASSTTDDEVSVVGNLTLGGILNITDIGGFGNGAYKLFDYFGALDYTTGDVTFGAMPTGYSYEIDTTSNANSVYLIVVPEPGRICLMALGVLALAFRRRRS